MARHASAAFFLVAIWMSTSLNIEDSKKLRTY
jgi:hypothetical protein